MQGGDTGAQGGAENWGNQGASADAVARLAELGLPQNVEWVHQTTPALLDAVRLGPAETSRSPKTASWRTCGT